MAKVGVDEEEATNLNDVTDYDDTDNDTSPEEDVTNAYEQNPSKQDFFYEDEAFQTATHHAYIKIGLTELVVSSEGTIRKADDIFSTSKGFVLTGTPYRTYPVEIERHKIEEYYVHDIVWRVFHGDPPEGWEVRHNMWEAKTGSESYSNALNNLNIYPITVTYMPSVRACLPEPDL